MKKGFIAVAILFSVFICSCSQEQEAIVSFFGGKNISINEIKKSTNLIIESAKKYNRGTFTVEGIYANLLYSEFQKAKINNIDYVEKKNLSRTTIEGTRNISIFLFKGTTKEGSIMAIARRHPKIKSAIVIIYYANIHSKSDGTVSYKSIAPYLFIVNLDNNMISNIDTNAIIGTALYDLLKEMAF